MPLELSTPLEVVRDDPSLKRVLPACPPQLRQGHERPTSETNNQRYLDHPPGQLDGAHA
jgi:hypothetical protein